MLDQISQLVIFIFGALGIILIARKNKWGFVLGLLTQPFWYITSFIHKQWGIFFVSIGYTLSWLYGIYHWFSDKNKINYSVKVNGRERNVSIPAVYALLIRDGKILLTHRFNTGYQDNKYMVPSGHVEGGETYTQALIREVKEEVGIILVTSNCKVLHIMNRLSEHKSERVDVFFYISEWEGEVKNTEPEKCDEVGWYDLDNLPKNTVKYLVYALDKIKNNILYSEYGWD